SQSIASVAHSMTAPREGERDRAARRPPGPPVRLRLRAGFGAVLGLRARLAHLDRGIREVRGEVVEPAVEAAVAVLVGGADPRPVPLLAFAPLHHAENFHRLLSLHRRPPFHPWPVLANSFTRGFGN